MVAEEPGLTLETVASILMKEKVNQLGEKFILVASIHLKVLGEDEHLPKGWQRGSPFMRNR